MKEYFFLLSSITSAMKGEGILRKKGFRASVFRDTNLNPYGCGYVIKAAGEKEKMEYLLKSAGIRINEIKESR
ncbi:MAG: DUF3343 domain-containing protein [Oscillospiraceae bacterium]|nr:DUF3343 domain-containing protein [Oscillospiraceae bacterium]